LDYFFIYTFYMNDELKNQATIIGFREWVSLPNLGLMAIKAKIDTGAKTSSLHAFDIEIEETRHGKTYVMFKVHPLQNEMGLVVSCRALMVDRRVVTDSGGHREERYVIRTTFTLAGIRKKIELTLSNRESMKYRMLIGREALAQYYIDPSQSYLAGKTLRQKRFLKELKTELEKDA
jgi:hypothetical protein